MEWHKYIIRALEIYEDRENCTYCLGGSGELAESNKIKNLYEYYYKVGYKSITMPYNEWLKINKGKRCFDCSGFLDYVFMGENSNHPWSSHTWRSAMLEPTKDLSGGVACSILWKNGHVGLDIGYGRFLHFPDFNRTCEWGVINKYNWEYSGKCPNVDYAGSDSR